MDKKVWKEYKQKHIASALLSVALLAMMFYITREVVELYPHRFLLISLVSIIIMIAGTYIINLTVAGTKLTAAYKESLFGQQAWLMVVFLIAWVLFLIFGILIAVV